MYETVLSLPDSEKTKQFTIAQLIKDVKQIDFAGTFIFYINKNLEKAEGRGLLVRLFHSYSEYSNERQFYELTGLATKTKLTLAEWSSWIFTELQAIRAVTMEEYSDD